MRINAIKSTPATEDGFCAEMNTSPGVAPAGARLAFKILCVSPVAFDTIGTNAEPVIVAVKLLLLMTCPKLLFCGTGASITTQAERDVRYLTSASVPARISEAESVVASDQRSWRES